MSTTSFSWLHLTDLHYGLKGQGHLWPNLREPFLDSLAALHERCGPWDAVLFTGDLVQSGESAQFERMQAEFLDPLWKRLGELGSGDAVLLAVPGNHDLYRPNSNEDNAAIDVLLEKDGFQRIEEKFWDRPTGPYRRVISDAFAAYSQWWDKAPNRAGDVKVGILPGDFSVTIERGGRRIGIVGLNTTFLQLAGGNYKERLVWDARQLHAVCEGGVDVWSKQHDVCLLLTHQGPDWLTPDARKHGESEIAPAGRFAVHLFGHMHEADIAYIRRGGSRFAVRLSQGCSVFGMERFGEPPTIQRAHGYAAERIDFGKTETVLRLWPRIATSKTGLWRFIPDGEHTELEDDEGTSPDVVASRARAEKTPLSRPVPTLTRITLAPHSTLPARRPFFGRKKHLELIAKYLLPEERSWGVVLDGPGGVGKTALALEAAHRAPAEHFPLKLWITAKNRELLPEGERWLAAHRVDDFNEMLNELGRALGREDIPKAVPGERPDLVRHALADYRVLLVLDNLETFNAEERRRVLELLGSLPATCRAIVTSRLRSDGSMAAHYLRVDKLDRESADELLSELGARWAPVARLTQDERDRLYDETSGNPLLLTWLAGQLGRTIGRCRTVAEAVDRLKEANQQNDPLGFVFGDLIETFTADETTVLSALVHFTQPVPIEWLLPLTELSGAAAETALDSLRDRALLVEDDKAATWLLPPLAAQFLRRAQPEAVVISGERLAKRIYTLSVENGYQNLDRFPILESAWPEIAASLPVLIAGDNHRLQVVCDALRGFLNFSGRWDAWLTLSSEAEIKAEISGDFYNAGWRAHDAGWCHLLRGQAAEVLACAERAATHWQAVQSGARERAAAISLRGHGYLVSKDYKSAIASFREALDVLSLAPPSEAVSENMSSLAEALRESGHFDEAEDCLREAVVIAKALRDLNKVAIYTGKLAELSLDREQWKEAERRAREALILAEIIGYRQVIDLHRSYLDKALQMQGRGIEDRGKLPRTLTSIGEATREFIIDHINDDDEDIRDIIEALAKGLPSEEASDVAHRMALYSTTDSARDVGIELLARVIPKDKRTLTLLGDLALGHESDSTRLKAGRELATLGWEDFSTRALVRKIINTDRSSSVRLGLRQHVVALRPRLAGLWEGYFRGERERANLPSADVGYPAIRVKQFRLRSIGAFADTGVVSLSSGVALLLGNNSSGKSTLLRCLALAAVGSDAANEIEQRAASYLRRGSERGSIEVNFDLIPDPDCLEEEYGTFTVGIGLEENSERFTALADEDITLIDDRVNADERLNLLRKESSFSFGLCCAYGATRTFSQNRFALEQELPREVNEWVIPLFSSDAGIINPDVLSRVIKGDARNINIPNDLLDEGVLSSVRQGLSRLLPAHEELYSEGAWDLRLNGVDLKFGELSDGYKSLLAVLAHLLRSLLRIAQGVADLTKIHGLVFIDEVDLHLHPEWQRGVMLGLREAFPNIQFIVSTHSPIIAGTCSPREIRRMELASDGSVGIKEYTEQIYGLDAEQILLGSYFNLDSTRAPGFGQDRRRLAQMAADGDPDGAVEFIRLHRSTRGSED